MVASQLILFSIGSGGVKDSALPLSEGARKVANTLSHEERKLPGHWREWAQYSIAGNEVWRYLFLAGTVVLTLLVGRLVRSGLDRAARRFNAGRRDLLATTCQALARASGFFALVIGWQVGLNFLVLGARADIATSVAGSLLMTLALGYAGYCLVSVAERWLRDVSAGSTRLDEMLVPLLSTSLRLAVLVFVLIEAAAVFERPITPLIAGLGVGGLAIGLAAQDTIKNFFGSLMIFSDRPFDLGDEIKVDAIGGTVESVGFRSTRLRTAEGFLVAISNGELANKTIVNVSRRPYLWRQFNLPLSYDLPAERLERAGQIVAELLRDHEGSRVAHPPRVFVGDFTPSAVNLTISYWYYPADWWRFQAFNQRTNLEILRRFAAEGIELAYPTQTIRLPAAGPGQPAGKAPLDEPE